MIESSKRKLVTIVLTALLFVSAFVVLPQNSASAADAETYYIQMTVIDEDTKISIETATVILTEVHTGAIVHAYYDDAGSYVADDPLSGHYRIDVSAEDYYSERYVDGFRFNGTKNYTYPSLIELTEFGRMDYTCNVTVNDGSSNPIDGAEVMFYDRTRKQMITSNTTDANGQTSVKTFGGTNLDLVVTVLNYESYAEELSSVSGDFNRTITMNDSAIVYGTVRKTSGEYAKSVVAYMYNTNSSIPWEKRVLKDTGNLFRFDAYVGDWILIIDGSDVEPYVEYYNISAVDNYFLDIHLDDQSESIEEITLQFADWNHLTIYINSTWEADWTYPGLDYADIGSLRAQIDLAIGKDLDSVDGVIDVTEYGQFYDYLFDTHGPNYVTTSDLFEVNETAYISTSTVVVGTDLFTGSVTVTDNISYNSEVAYSSLTSLDTNSSIYTAEITVPYDSASMNREFEIVLVSDYELVNNETFTSKVDVSGYMTVVVDPQYSSIPGSETVRLDFERSEKPTAEAKILTTYGGGVAYKKMNNTTILYYVVKNDTAIRFSSVGSHDPNGNPVTFTWNFGDGSENTTDSMVFDHNFTAAAENLTVTLTVDDVSGMTNNTSFQLYVDALSPRAIIDVWNQTGEEITIDQGDSLEFSPTGSVDDLVNVSDEKGEILTYEWTFGDEGVEVVGAEEDNLTVSHEFNIAGNVTVVLNITDVVTNWANATVKIVVIDTTSPIPSLDIPQNETGGTSLKEKSPVFFNANGTTDNFYDLENLTFEWDFGDDSDLLIGNGSEYAIVNHTYTSYGQYDITLNVTDERDNTGTLTQKVSIGSGPRPRLEADKIAFDPLTFEEGVIGTITVNITNDGSAVAKNITIEIWYYSLDVPQELIGTTTTIFDENGTVISSIEVGDSGYGIFQWTPSAKGNYSLRVYVNSTDQINPNWEPGYILVNEAGWKKTALYGGVLAIFIVIPLLLFVRRRIASGGGVRRIPKEKKERKK